MFVSQATLDQWLGDDIVDVDGDVMAIRRLGHRFQLNTAYHFLSEVAEGGDSGELVGKVKTLDQVVALGGEHCAGSVILGDNAYDVVEGFLGLPLEDSSAPSVSGSSLASATRAAAGDGNPPSQELDILAQFFLGSKG